MAVIITRVTPGSPADKAGIRAGSRLISVDGNPINDVLDYMYYADDDMGLEFGSFLMDEKRGCGNNCVFCFIDQLPRGMRRSLYFKDDDSRLSFLQGNYITLTNLTPRDVERILLFKTPVNVSVHSTNPGLRSRLMGNPRAADSLETLYRFARAGISMNCQLVLCPGLNDGAELERSLNDLTAFPSIESIACVPVGLTKHRAELPELRRHSPEEAAAVIAAADRYPNVFAADEFYLTAGISMPGYEHYGAFPQYENGVGMCAYMERTFRENLPANPTASTPKTIITGTAAAPLLRRLTRDFPWVTVVAIRNNFFGESVTVSGLLTGRDIIAQTRELNLKGELLIGANTLNADGVFLDDVTPAELEKSAGVKVTVVEPDGLGLAAAL